MIPKTGRRRWASKNTTEFLNGIEKDLPYDSIIISMLCGQRHCGGLIIISLLGYVYLLYF
ncbi:MAG TPA: hypothetical protein PLA81_06370 [Syntrophorhabdaceae bacterium]|nr:hypothetical protein [Syntrophorhabdaceae bacterium]HPL41200.1 hypothetical protein [Syntrophorhabdaceae bacterium]HQG49755.1 hypothetical protein [Syntrophorhabdaceae bacterium]